MLEPASQGVPVLCGPHTEHSRDQVALLQGQGLQEVADVDALAAAMARALRDPDFARAQGALARAAAGRGTGAAARCAQVLLPALDARRHSTS
jgi:3-deoxy-D-manno-octulosonic-acid transferase